MYPGVKRSNLSEEQKQTISTLATVSAGLTGGLTDLLHGNTQYTPLYGYLRSQHHE
nr:VENN motif pre-toxin domain-containing protein [Escherichia coli]